MAEKIKTPTNGPKSVRPRNPQPQQPQLVVWAFAIVAVVVAGFFLLKPKNEGASTKPVAEQPPSHEVMSSPTKEKAKVNNDPMDFSDLKQELYGDKSLGSGTVGESDAKNAREAIRDLAYGSDFRQVMNGMIGPGRYGTYDEAVRHLRPYLEQATKQGALRPEVLAEIDAQNAANEKQRQNYYSK